MSNVPTSMRIYIFLFLAELGTKTICIDHFTRYYNKTIGWDSVIITCDTSGYFARSKNRLDLGDSPSCPGSIDDRYCLIDTRDRNCDGLTLCRIEARFVRRWRCQNCYNSISMEYECVTGEDVNIVQSKWTKSIC